MRTVRVLAADSMEGRKAGTPGGARARTWLLAQLRALHLAPLGAGYEHPFPLPDSAIRGVNLLAVIPGTTLRDRYIVLSAHYDHLGTIKGEVYNGADDNASGVAAVLAMAQALAARPLGHSVIIALFDAEEEGLLGAKAFVASPPVPKSGLALDVNLDMVSHSTKDELYASGASRWPALRPTLEALAKQASVRLLLGHDRAAIVGKDDWTHESDQGPFHDAGIPFIYFGVEDHPDYHKPTDDPETITPAFFGRAVATILEALRRFDRVVP
jgi:Zn-dependent M28 family amino/carboxypeptidase